MYIRRTSMFRWTDSGTEAVLPVSSIKGEQKKQVDGYDNLAHGGTYSEEHWLGLKYQDATTHSKISNARVTKLHGSYQTGHVLNAGYTNVWAAPKAAAAASTIATAAMPANLSTSFHGTAAQALEIETYDLTDLEYQFLVLQHKLTSVGAAFDPEKQVGTSGYAFVEVAYKITDLDNDRTNVPGGNDQANTFSQTPIDVYIVINDEQQLFGCCQNAVTAGFGLEWDKMAKGALQGTASRFLTSRESLISGNLYSYNVFNWVSWLYGVPYASNGTSTRINISSDWQPVKTVEILMDTVSPQGKRLTVHAPQAYLKVNGDIPFGDGVSMMPWQIDLGESVNLYLSDDCWDMHRFWVDIELT